MRRSWVIAALVLAGSLAGGCAEGGGITLSVVLRTDFIPLLEFHTVELIMDGDERFPVAVDTAIADADYFGGVPIGGRSFGQPGTHTVSVSLLASSTPVLDAQRVEVDLVESTTVPVTITRDCLGVRCGATQQCLSGACAPRTCSPLRPEDCADRCVDNRDCTSEVACARGRCIEGVCLFAPNDAVCAMDERCDPSSGCVLTDTRTASLSTTPQIPIGGWREIAVTLTGSWVPGDQLEISTNAGQLRGDGPPATRIVRTVSVTGEVQGALLEVPFDHPVGATIELTTNARMTEGVTQVEVVEPDLYGVVVGRGAREVADGLELEATLALPPEDQALAERMSLIGIRPRESFLPQRPLVVVDEDPAGAPATVMELQGPELVTHWQPAAPGVVLEQLTFTNSAEAWDEEIVGCVSGDPAGVAIHYIRTAELAPFFSGNDCRGVAFDLDESLAHHAAGTWLYAVDAVNGLRALGPTGEQSHLSNLPASANGYRLHIPRGPAFAGALFAVSEDDGTGRGQVFAIDDTLRAEAAVPFVQMTRIGRGGVSFSSPGPEGELPFGERMWVALADEGAIRAYRPDGTYTVAARGFDALEGLVVSDEAVWFVDRGAGQIFRLVPPR